jgi:hypothetical protein
MRHSKQVKCMCIERTIIATLRKCSDAMVEEVVFANVAALE